MHYRYASALANIIFSEQTGKGKRNTSHCFDAKLLKLHRLLLFFGITDNVASSLFAEMFEN